MCLIEVGSLCCFDSVAAPSKWFVARSPHFEVYSQAGADHAHLAAVRFEELRSFFDRNHVIQSEPRVENRLPVRVIGFSSKREYEAFKPHPTADAYYTNTADRDYIVMPMLAGDDVTVSAHEYAHFLLSSRRLKLPAWLSEGIAEVFSTVRITSGRCELGGQLSAHTETLRRHPWLSATDLLSGGRNSQWRDARTSAAVFYAESWALVDMLTSSPEYASHFGDLIGMLNSEGITSQQALAKIYGKSLSVILSDVKEWIDHARSSRRTVPSIPPERLLLQVNQISDYQAQVMTADLLFTTGKLARAEQIYKQLLSQSPTDPEILGSLGTVALRQGNRLDAVQYFRRALDHKLHNAAMCYGYALLAEEMDLPSDEIERALQQAITIQQNFDDARYKLALLKSNAGEYDSAIRHLQLMEKPSVERAFGYWTALAYALSKLDKRDEAESAARQATQFAMTPEERARASGLAYVAKTDLTVRFVRDAEGKLQLATTRIPHTTTDFNPFVEPGDQIQVATGRLREVQCSEGRLTGFLVDSKTETLTLSVPDPMHVLMRNAPSEFSCGPQVAREVKIEYATVTKSNTNLLRGMEFQ